MYKTIKQGDNSLQYTIVPQTEEVIDNCQGVRGTGRDYSPFYQRRIREVEPTMRSIVLGSFCAVFTLILVAIPVVVIDSAMRPINKTHRSMFTFGSLFFNDNHVGETDHPKPTMVYTLTKGKTTESLPLTIYEKTTYSPVNLMPRAERKTTARPLKPIQKPKLQFRSRTSAAPVTEKQVNWGILEFDTILTPIITSKPQDFKEMYKDLLKMYPPATDVPTTTSLATRVATTQVIITEKEKVPASTVKTTLNDIKKKQLDDLKDTILSADDDDDFKESLEVDEVFSLPPMKPEWLSSHEDDDDVLYLSTKQNTWYGVARWPLFDSSPYLKWKPVFSTSDNWVLPLVVGSLISLALLTIVVMTVRRRRMRYQSGNRLVSPGPYEDSNLLSDTTDED